jgi:hypothetical protein
MNIQYMSNHITLEQIIHKRIPPYCWDITGYTGGLITIFYYNKIGIIIYSCIFGLYLCLNILFDYYSVSFEYSNNNMPNYKNIGNYNLFITNKMYILQNINNSLPFDTINIIDNSKLKIELSIYIEDNWFIKKLLLCIYYCGITQKNYTSLHYNNFKDNTIYFV